MERIEWWNIEIKWDDGRIEKLADVPNWVAKHVDEYLDELETEINNG